MSPSKLRVVSAEEIRQQGRRTSSTTSNPKKQQTLPRLRGGGSQEKIDIRKTRAYKTASRKWISTIVALPILFYTSWELYERTYGGKVQKSLLNVRRKAKDEVSSEKSGN